MSSPSIVLPCHGSMPINPRIERPIHHMLTRPVISANYMLLIYYHIRIHAIDNKCPR